MSMPESLLNHESPSGVHVEVYCAADGYEDEVSIYQFVTLNDGSECIRPLPAELQPLIVGLAEAMVAFGIDLRSLVLRLEALQWEQMRAELERQR